MMQPSDNELDKMIKEAGDNHQPDGASPDWEQMQSLLDKHMPEKKAGGRRLFLLLLLLVLLFGGSYFYFTFNDKPVETVARQSTNEQSAPRVPQSATLVPLQPSVVDKPEDASGTADHTNKNIQPSSQKSTGQANAVKVSKKTLLIKNVRRYNTHIKAGASTEADPVIDSKNAASQEDKKYSSIISQDTTTTVSTMPGEVNDSRAAIDQKKSLPDTQSIAKKEPALPAPVAKDKKQKNIQKSNHSLEFTLLYAPELTTIGFSKIDKPGSNYGLLVAYPIAKNALLQTGVIRSRKNYIAAGDEFVLGYALPADHTLTKVSGYCMMYEIPLNLKFYTPGRKKLKLFYTAGVSSYFMEREFYTYHYKTATGEYDKSKSYNSQRNYWFSLATLSVGLEKQLSDNMHVAAAPFLKIPFKGMGEGKLKLLGTGINFSLIYNPARSGNK